jgi:hypothetical protein
MLLCEYFGFYLSDFVLDDVESQVVRHSHCLTALDAAACEPHAESERMMIASFVSGSLGRRISTIGATSPAQTDQIIRT